MSFENKSFFKVCEMVPRLFNKDNSPSFQKKDFPVLGQVASQSESYQPHERRGVYIKNNPGFSYSTVINRSSGERTNFHSNSRWN